MYLGGGFKRKKHRRNHRGKQAGRLRTGNANSGSILFFFVLVLILDLFMTLKRFLGHFLLANFYFVMQSICHGIQLGR
jgi:hypothetical protein